MDPHKLNELICTLVVTAGKIKTMVKFADDAIMQTSNINEDAVNSILILQDLSDELQNAIRLIDIEAAKKY